MKILPGTAGEYQRRHNEIWPELSALLKQTGISAYSIFLDEVTNELFAVFTSSDQKMLDELPNNPLMKKWWDYMSNISIVNADNSPVVTSLKEVFYLA